MTPRPYTPRPYGRLATRFLYDHPRCNLWAAPGMGKTSIVYALLDLLQLVGSNFFPVLVIAPLNVALTTWPQEQKKWIEFAGLKVVPILGGADARDDALMTRGDVYLINYDNIQWLMDRKKMTWPFRCVVADESTKLKSFRGGFQTNEHGTTFLRTAGGVRASALARISEKVGRWINLTGTPAPNGLKDIWGQNWFVDHGERLGWSYGDYMRRWFYENPYSKIVEIRHPDCEKEIHARIADVTMALRPEDWFDIKEPIVTRRPVHLPPEARKAYSIMERDFFAEIAGKEISAANAAVLSSKLLQMASGAVYGENQSVAYVHDAKIEDLRSLVEELNEPLLVAYWFKFEVGMLKKAFPEMRFYSGPKDEDLWNQGKIPMMGIHPASAGHGISLHHGGRAMAHFSHAWDLELKLQVSERIGPTRQAQAGYNRNVLHYEICATETMDEVVLERQLKKQTIQQALLDARAVRGL